MKYIVYIDENSHYGDKSESYLQGEYEGAEEALDAARKIVDESLASLYTPGMLPEMLYQSYQMFGEDPFIISAGARLQFSAWDYASEKVREICDQTKI